MKEQFEKAGYKAAGDRLAEIAREIVSKERNLFKAAPLLWGQIKSDAALLWAVFKPFQKAAAQRVLAAAFAEVRSGHGRCDPHASTAAPGAGHVHSDPHVSDVRATHPDADEAVDAASKDHTGAARPASGPVVSESMLRVVRSCLDSFRITDRQGSRIPIGDLRLSAIAGWADRMGKNTWVNARERELLLMISAAASTRVAHASVTATVRDIFTADEIEMFIQQAGGIAKHPDLSGFYETWKDGEHTHA